MSPLAFKLLLAFIWLTLVYVLTVFTDLTSHTFVKDGGVATSSLLFIALAVGFGLFVYRLKIRVLLGVDSCSCRWSSSPSGSGRCIPIQRPGSRG